MDTCPGVETYLEGKEQSGIPWEEAAEWGKDILEGLYAILANIPTERNLIFEMSYYL